MPRLFVEKMDWLRPLIQGKKVLDIGCVAHSLEEARRPDWLHGQIVKAAAEAVGVDILKHEIEVLRAERNFDLVWADVETMDLQRKFDVVVMMDVIEHLTSPGHALRRVREHLERDGTVIITTPNPVNWLRFVALLASGKVDANPEHTCWFNEPVLRELARRCGLALVSVAYIDDSFQYYQARKLWWPIWAMNRVLAFLRPQLCETFGFIFRLDEAFPEATRSAGLIEHQVGSPVAGVLHPMSFQEIQSLHLQQQGRSAADGIGRTIAQFFTAPNLGSDAERVTAYQEVAARVQVAFEAPAKVWLTAIDQEEGENVGLKRFLLRYEGGSRWLTIEIGLTWTELEAASQFSIGVFGITDRPILCIARLRLPRRDGSWRDEEVARFALNPTNFGEHKFGELKFELDAKGAPPKLLLFFDSTKEFELELHYLVAQFV